MDIINPILNASLAPLGCVKQDTTDEHGNKIQKFRMTHDETFPGPSGLSVNLRVVKIHLPPILNSFALIRSIHYIVNFWLHHRNTKIFICKVDLDAAYCHCSLSSTTATKYLTMYDGLFLTAFWMKFGGAPCSSLWGVIYETMADLGNSLLWNPFWDHSQEQIQDWMLMAMQSCEYVQVSGPHKTKILAVKNTKFFKGKR